ncbi:HAMP domain-containing sensor histidine kinase [Flavobacterium sp. CS20]|uniref:sensor histidine kinase n=1 Tax=Flavobacterium sp. CS20 TaxID=2775246 RepID=UPI001B3A72A0|nr:HAMP domain-containing sensor histidine kinase [Flavobacterium sp. CS20]QTY26385.1 HAMP domain-containing histidine kinase [Flavobacterium sp. CS20]
MIKNTKNLRGFIAIASLIIVGLTTWSIFLFYERIKADERLKMEILSEAIKAIDADDVSNYRELVRKIQNSNSNIPGVIVNDKGEIVFKVNLPQEIEKDSIKLYNYLENIKDDNAPLEINLGDQNQILYYGNSELLTKIKYYPLILLVIILLFIGLLYFFYTTSKESEKNKLWAGMAKETAHQIGTPLSSLVGWLEILKSENLNQDYIIEIKKDIDRLQTIAERFSKVGSKVNLEKTDIIEVTQSTFDYLKNRSSNLITFSIDMPKEPTYVMLNKPLYSWTIENLVKNAIDAMKGKGELKIEIVRSGNWVRILVKDSGKGISLNHFKTIFKPGFTTKKRGWGLGLSLAKRIIEDYHNGKIKVLFSELGKGTTFEIKLKKQSFR